MKLYRTRFLKITSVCLMGYPLTYVILAGMLFDVPPSNLGELFLSPLFYIISAVGVTAGIGLWEMKRWGWYVFVTTVFLTVWQNLLVVWNLSESHHKIFAFLFSVFFLFLIVFFLSAEIRVPYFLPRIRWWESTPKFSLETPAVVFRKNKLKNSGIIVDLAVAGCFVKTSESFKQNEKVKIQFKLFGEEMTCPGEVVWVTHSAVTHPRGIGVKFERLEGNGKQLLLMMSRRVRKIASLQRKSRFSGYETEFMETIEKLSSNSPANKEDDKF